MKRSATAVWSGDGKSGAGRLSTGSGALAGLPVSYTSRFVSEDGAAGTNPEELLGAAHAGCFAMATAFALAGAGFTAERLDVTATVDFRPIDGKPTVVSIALALEGRVPGVDTAKFVEIAEGAKAGCPISRALAAVPITLDARLA